MSQGPVAAPLPPSNDGDVSVRAGDARAHADRPSLPRPTLEVDLSAPGVLRVLEVMLGATVVAGLTAALIGVVSGRLKHIVVGLVAAAIHAVLLVLARRGIPARTIATTASISILTTAVLLAVAGNGLHDVSMVLFQLPMVIASLVLSRRRLLVIGSLVIAGVAGVGTAEITGALATPMSQATSYDDIFVVALILGLSAVMTRSVVGAMYEGFRIARASEQTYREIFDGTGEAVFIHDVDDGRILDVNRTGMAMFGYTHDELLGMTLRDLGEFSAEDAEDATEERLRQAVGEGHVTFEWRARAKDGRLFHVESNLRGTQIGGKGRVLAAVRDIDDRRRLEESLTQAEKLQAVGQLAGGVAHDFNNQLTGIIAGAELLRRRLGDDPISQEYADIILQASRRSADLVGNLLAFARRAKRQEVDVDVRTVVEEVVGLLQRSIDRRIEIEMRVPSTPIRVNGDPALLSNALLNLGLNARDAMPGGGCLRFEVELLEAAEVRPDVREVVDGFHIIRIRVRDTGHGMDEATEQRIFEPFFTTKASGTGMGLAAVYGTVKSHGGTVLVDTHPGEGTTFTLYLPAVPVAEAARNASSSPKASGASLDLVVLLAEDEPAVAAATRAMLETIGCRVVLAKSGREAVDLFRKEPGVDLVLFDRMMPVITGDRALREIRAIDSNMPAILASGYTDPPGDGEAIEGRPVVSLSKPFALGELEHAVREAVFAHGDPA